MGPRVGAMSRAAPRADTRTPLVGYAILVIVALSGEAGFFGLSQTPATRRSAPGHAESRAKLLDDEGQPKKDQTKGSEGPTCRPHWATAGAAPTRTATT